MNPWDIVAWVGAIAASLVIAVLAVGVVVALVRAIKNPTPSKGPTSIIQRGDRS